MACRTYDIKLDCGCMYSADGGGGLMPCIYEYEGIEEDEPDIEEQREKCDKAHKKWEKTPAYTEFNKECMRRNQ